MAVVSLMCTGWFGISVLLTAAAMPMATLSALADDGIDMRDDQHWDWSLDRANPLHCLLQQSGVDYDVTLVGDHREPGMVKIVIARDHKSAYEWVGHAHTVFEIVGDRLYYADYSTLGTGGAIVAVDLTTGNVVWREKLEALGPIEHSKYLNRMNLAADASSVRITGNESAGRYVEVKDAATGRTIAHRKFTADAASVK